MGDINRCVNCGEDWIEYHVCPRTFISTMQPLAPNVSPTSEIDTLRARIAELESALAKSASREAALNNADTGVCAFKEWYDAIWLGDQEHGQVLPKSGPEYDRYMDGYTLAYGAWNAALAKIKEAS